MNQAGKTKKILRIIAFCLAIGVLVAVLYAFACAAFAKIKNPNAIPMPLGFGMTFVLSGSMEPGITTDDLVLLKKPGKLQVGDVVLFNTGKSNVLHRIVEIQGDTLITQGDANNTTDPPFSKSAVLGQLLTVIPNGAKVVRTVTNLPFVMGVFVLLVGAAFAWMYAEEKKEQKRLRSLRAEIAELKEEIETIKGQTKS